MLDLSIYKSNDDIAWCPGCGNFGILISLKEALAELNLKPEDIVLVSGIGQLKLHIILKPMDLMDFMEELFLLHKL